MKMNLFWTLLGLMIVLILALAYFNFFHQKSEKIEVEEKKVEIIYQEDCICDQLEKIINFIDKRMLELEERIAKHSDKPVAQATPVRAAAPASPSPAPAPPPKPEPEPLRANTSDLSHVKNVNGDIIFCVMANNDGGMHFPQYALDRNVRFTAVASNTTQDGSNWIVKPTREMEGDYGITYDGTFFVSHEVLQATMSQPLSSLAIKSEFTRWQPLPMKKENGYWIYRTR